MRVPLLYKKAGPRHVWGRLRDMVCEYQFAVAVVIPAADLDRFIREYFAAVAKRDYDSCVIYADRAAAPAGEEEFYAGLGRLLAGEDLLVDGIRVKEFILTSEQDEMLLASNLFKFGWNRNFVVVNSGKPHVWDYISPCREMTLIHFVGPDLCSLYIEQGFMVLPFDLTGDYAIFTPPRY